MAELRRFDLDDIMHRPGTYVNPHTEIVLVVDDSASVDHELLGGDEDSWVLVSDETPIDEAQRDDLLERLQRRTSRATTSGGALDDVDSEEELEDEEDLGRAGFDDPRARDAGEDDEDDWT